MHASSYSVLVVDDQDGVRQLLFEILNGEGYRVKLASSGKEALDLLEGFRPDVILIDMKMPGMSGLDVLRRLKQVEYGGKYVLMTAYGELEIVNEAAQLGVRHHINKPFDIDELRDVIQRVCSDNYVPPQQDRQVHLC